VTGATGATGPTGATGAGATVFRSGTQGSDEQIDVGSCNDNTPIAGGVDGGDYECAVTAPFSTVDSVEVTDGIGPDSLGAEVSGNTIALTGTVQADLLYYVIYGHRGALRSRHRPPMCQAVPDDRR
jgi:hypothetical protein